MLPYRELLLWQTTMDLAEAIYRYTRDFPLAERLGLAAELRQSAIALPAGVAENCNLPTPGFLRGLRLTSHVLLRLENQTILAQRLRYWPPDQFDDISRRIVDVQRLLQAFFNSLGPLPNESAADSGRGRGECRGECN